jgi:hypothetical protein
MGEAAQTVTLSTIWLLSAHEGPKCFTWPTWEAHRRKPLSEMDRRQNGTLQTQVDRPKPDWQDTHDLGSVFSARKFGADYLG